jgi:hypothetical protein
MAWVPPGRAAVELLVQPWPAPVPSPGHPWSASARPQQIGHRGLRLKATHPTFSTFGTHQVQHHLRLATCSTQDSDQLGVLSEVSPTQSGFENASEIMTFWSNCRKEMESPFFQHHAW